MWPSRASSASSVKTPVAFGTAPSHALNRYENYHIDTAIPEHHVTFNGIVELPVGRGKRWLRNSSKLLDALVGGYQVAFVGQVVSQSFQVAASNWGATSPAQIYGSSAPINDCRSGVCHPAYLWFNGYVAPTVINAKNGIVHAFSAGATVLTSFFGG